MPHHDDKGRISPAQSKAARQMRGNTNLPKPWREQRKIIAAEGRVFHRAAISRDIHSNKSAKLKAIKRGQKSQIRRDYTKGLTEYHGGIKGQRAYKKAHEERY
jgi:hypothetical protein